MTLMTSKTKVHLLFVWMSLVLVATVSGCGGGSGADGNDKNRNGGVAFSLYWNTPPSQGAQLTQPQAVNDDVCTNYQIEWIHGHAIDQSGNEQNKAMWRCSDRRGELKNLPVGTYRIVIKGEVADEITWRGEAVGVQVIKNETTDAGSILMAHLDDQVAPTVVETLPADGAVDVAINSNLSATFDEAIVIESISKENFILTYTDNLNVVNSVDCTVEYQPGTRTAVLSPTEPLINDTTYTATIAIDRTLVVEDLAGNPMQQNKLWTFTTFRPDVEAPNIIYRSPASAEMDVESTTKVEFEFSEPVLSETITTDSILLQCEGTDIPYRLDFDELQNMVTLTPRDSLPAGSTCTVTANTAITDLAGNPFAANESWSFVTRFAPWRHEPVSDATSLFTTTIAMEPNERIHINYINMDNILMSAIRSSENAFDIWKQLIVPDVSVRPHQDMVITSSAEHIVYVQEDPPGLTVCTYILGAGAFICSLVDESNALQGCSIAAYDGPYGGPAICYYDGNGSQIKYAVKSPNWAVETIENGGGPNPSITLSPGGAVHLSYIDAANNQLKYATKLPEGSWEKEVVDPNAIAGKYSDIAVDGSGNPHISYLDVNTFSLKYAAKQTSGKWLIETADPGDGTDGSVTNIPHGSVTSIALDSLGNAHISYRGLTDSVLKYASRTSLGLWHTGIADNLRAGDTGASSSIMVDKQDRVHISYLHYEGVQFSGGAVRYVTNRPAD